MKTRSFAWSLLGGAVGCAVGIAIGLALAGDEVGKLGDWRYGALRFIGFTGALGLFGGFIIVSRFTRPPAMTRRGFRLSHGRIEPVATGYRDLKTLTVDDVLAGLRAVGYEPTIQACDVDGTRLGNADPSTPLVGANIAIADRRVRGWVRLQLIPPNETQTKALGALEAWSERGGSAEELAMFSLRVLDKLVPSLAAAHDDSRLSEDPASLLTAGLPDAPTSIR